MSVDFGKISHYLEERGFGFVSGLLLGDHSEVFFHIKTVKKTDPRLAAKIAEEPFNNYHFWFETESTPKGKQVRSFITSEQMRRGVVADTSLLAKGIEAFWLDVDRERPDWLDGATIDLVGSTRANELSAERQRLYSEAQRSREAARKAFEAKQAIIKEAHQAQLDAKRAQEEIEEKEFQDLVAEMKQIGYTHSSQVSNYIVSNRLGYKYRNISGVLQMELNGTIWNFKGGFPPNIYARLCNELDLSNEGTKAKPIAFESFDSIEERFRRK
jgi:cold shock CspA family protein